MKVKLTQEEVAVLFRQNPETERDGGFQGLLVGLQSKTDKESGDLDVSEEELERIPRYAFDYKNGGWENRLISIFARSLGPKLGR